MLVGLATAIFAFVLWSAFAPNQPSILLENVTASPINNAPQDVVIFAKIQNGIRHEELISISSAVAEKTSLQKNLNTLAIPQNTTVSMAADSVHARLTNVKGDLSDGRTIPLTFTFREAGEVTARARLVAPTSTGSAPSLGLYGIGDICQVGDGEPAPQISLTATLNGDGLLISVLSKDFEFTPELVDGPHVPGTGHGHIYLNGLKLGRLYSPSHLIRSLPKGEHVVEVTLNTNDHRAYVVGKSAVRARIAIRAECDYGPESVCAPMIEPQPMD
ncbi:copper chaperone PCu(A)C [Shimia isoporae]|nr:copper chaperone PCu(A)C [Shimia isoporae]